MGCVFASQEQWHHAHAVVKAFGEEAKRLRGLPVVLLIAGNKERESIQYPINSIFYKHLLVDK